MKWPKLLGGRRGLKLRTDDRSSFNITPGSEDLATVMLRAAQLKAASQARGVQFKVSIPDGYSPVHNMELGLTLTNRAAGYGLEFVFQFNNEVGFRKL